MKTFRIGITQTIAGYVELQAEDEDDAKAAAWLTLDQKGRPQIPHLDITYRDCAIEDCEEA
jgi:hypothetical protein